MFFYSTKRNNIMQFFVLLQGPITVYGTMKLWKYFFSRQKTICTWRLNLGPMGIIWAFCSKADKNASSIAFPLTILQKQVITLFFYNYEYPKKGRLLILLSRLARYSQETKLKRILKSCESFLRKSQFSMLTILDLAGPGTFLRYFL